MGCLGECWDLGPPPDSILNIPPPPIPAFIQHSLPDLLLNTTPCFVSQLCESLPPLNRVPAPSGDYIEMPHKDVESWSVTAIDDTWLLVLVASSIGVLLLGALLAMFLLKCREMSMFDPNECSMHTRDHHRQIKNHEPRDCTSLANLNSNKLVHPTETVLYQHASPTPDNRMVWAALTPHGTQHFVSESYPRDLIDYANNDTDAHYETVDNLNIPPVILPYSYHNKGDYDYEDPAPLIESYQLNEMEGRSGEMLHNGHHHQFGGGMMFGGGNTDMRCASLGIGSLRRAGPAMSMCRPQVSSPTRIENPNLPPLNLYPHKGTSTLKRNNLSYRNVDTGTLPKYGC